MKQVVLLSVLSLFLFTGCHGVGGGVRVDAGSHYSHHAPPSHAPAHGRRDHYRYNYYPTAEFYFDTGRNMYFYLDSGGRWSFSVNLPLHLRSHLHDGYVEIEMEYDRPYLRHKDHKNKYKKHKYKNKKKKPHNKHDKHRDNDDDRHEEGERYHY